MLPKRRIAVGLLNASNFLTLVKNISTAVGEETPPVEMAPVPPLSLAVTIEGTGAGVVGYVPTAVVKELARAVRGLFMGMGVPQGAVQPVPMPGP